MAKTSVSSSPLGVQIEAQAEFLAANLKMDTAQGCKILGLRLARIDSRFTCHGPRERSDDAGVEREAAPSNGHHDVCRPQG
jgi:hypothetical protein